MTRDPHPIYEVLPTLKGIHSIIEVGCHRMEDTEELRKIFPLSRIIAFDPDPRNAAIIRKSGSPEKLQATFFELALSDHCGEKDFYLSTNSLGGDSEWTRSSSLRKPYTFRSEEHTRLLHSGVIPCIFSDSIKVSCATLDSFLFPCTLLWCDVQGAEDLVIAGAKDTLVRTKYLFIEHNTDNCYDGAPDRQKLQAMLPGWEPLYIWPNEMLMRNKSVCYEVVH